MLTQHTPDQLQPRPLTLKTGGETEIKSSADLLAQRAKAIAQNAQILETRKEIEQLATEQTLAKYSDQEIKNDNILLSTLEALCEKGAIKKDNAESYLDSLIKLRNGLSSRLRALDELFTQVSRGVAARGNLEIAKREQTEMEGSQKEALSLTGLFNRFAGSIGLKPIPISDRRAKKVELVRHQDDNARLTENLKTTIDAIGLLINRIDDLASKIRKILK